MLKQIEGSRAVAAAVAMCRPNGPRLLYQERNEDT
jgi:hypothetical protein